MPNYKHLPNANSDLLNILRPGAYSPCTGDLPPMIRHSFDKAGYTMWSCTRSGVVGYYPFGGTPTIVDPRTEHHDTSLTNVHEQVHRDLVNNTFYGYVLRRLRDLGEIPEAQAWRPQDLMADLSHRIFTTAEGSATATEWLGGTKRRGTAGNAAAEAELPLAYRDALSLFKPLIERSMPLPEDFEALRRATIVQASAELAADWHVVTAPPLPANFRQLTSQLTEWAGPDSVLPAVLRAAAAIPDEHFVAAFAAAQQGTDGSVLRFARVLIHKLKGVILAQMKVDPRPTQLIDDGERITAIATIDATLIAQYSALPHLQWTDEVLNFAVAVEVKEPEFLLRHVEVPAEELARECRELATRLKGFGVMVNNFQRLNGAYSVFAKPVVVLNHCITLGEPCLTCTGATAAQLEELEDGSYPIAWLAYGLPLEDGGFFDQEFMLGLRSRVFLHLPEFSWEAVMWIARSLPGSPTVTHSTRTPDFGYGVSAWQAGRFTIFGLTPPKLGGPSPDLELREAPILEDHVLAAVVAAVIRTKQP